jgi:hypothetical protein
LVSMVEVLLSVKLILRIFPAYPFIDQLPTVA